MGKYTVKDANEFIKNLHLDEGDIFRTEYHFMPKCGWCNDPHGIIYFKDKYYMFFQYYPYEPVAKDVHWGYTTTKDFVHFAEVRCALVPEKPYDNSGCWSGSVIIKDDTLYLYYTGFALKDDGKYYQTICLATTKDGETFTKYESNPVIGVNLIPEFANIYDFRDPNVFFVNDKLYLIVGTKNDHEAMTLLYSSEDMHHFKYEKVLLRSSDYGTMFECPNIIRFDDKAYIIMSPQNIKMKEDNFFNVSSCVYVPLPKDFINEEAKMEHVKEIDHGFEYYAPNVFDKEKILVSWQQLWGRRYYLKDIGKPYINNFSLFKKIVRDGDELKFVPLDVYKKYFINEEVVDTTLSSKLIKRMGITYHFDLEVEAKEGEIFTLELAKKDEESVKFILDVDKKRIDVDRTSLKEQLYGVDFTPATLGKRWLKLSKVDKVFKFEVYVDHEAIEVYVNDYKDSFHLLSFSLGEDIALDSNIKTHVKLIKHDIKV